MLAASFYAIQTERLEAGTKIDPGGRKMYPKRLHVSACGGLNTMLLGLGAAGLGCDESKFGLMREVNRACGLGSRRSGLIPERRTIGVGDSLFDLGSLNLQTRLER